MRQTLRGFPKCSCGANTFGWRFARVLGVVIGLMLFAILASEAEAARVLKLEALLSYSSFELKEPIGALRKGVERASS
jgi:hypothetical protein